MMATIVSRHGLCPTLRVRRTGHPGPAKETAYEKCCFSLSTVDRHLGVVGLHTVFWFPNMPTSCTALSSGTVSIHSTGTKYSHESECMISEPLTHFRVGNTFPHAGS